MAITENLKVELFSELYEQFPEKAEDIVKKAESLCKLEPDFIDLSDEKKADIVINKIFFEPSIIDENIYLVLRVNTYIKNINIESIANDFFSESKEIHKNPFFNQQSIKNLSLENNKDEIKDLMNRLAFVHQKAGELSVIINKEIKNQIEFISKIKFISDDSLKKKIKDIYQKTINLQNSLEEIDKETLFKYKELQKKYDQLNLSEEEKIRSENINLLNEQIKQIIDEQNKLVEVIENFQLLPIENILELPEIFDKFSNYILGYTYIKSLIISSNNINEFGEIENNFFENIKFFMEKLEKNFDKGLLEPKDKNKTFKNKFIEPIKHKLTKQNLDLLNCIIDSIY